MDWRKLIKSILYPHTAVMVVLLPIATMFLVFSMVYIGTESIPAYVSYVLAAYTLTIWCFRIPYLIRFFKTIKNENKYVKLWLGDLRLRSNIMQYNLCGLSVMARLLSSHLLVLFPWWILYLSCCHAILSCALFTQE